MHVLNHSHTSSEGHVQSVRHAHRPACSKCTREDTLKHMHTQAYMHAHSKRLSNVMCGDRLSALLKGYSSVKLHFMLGLQHGSIWLVKNSS